MVLDLPDAVHLRLYYQYDLDRLSMCPLTIHALLHVPNDIRMNGPPCFNWSFIMERWCNWLKPAASKSKQRPYVSIALRQYPMAVLHDLQQRFDLMDLFQPRDVPNEGPSKVETMFPECEYFSLPHVYPICPTY